MYYYLISTVVYIVEYLAAHIFFSQAGAKKYKPMYCYLIGCGLFAFALLVNIIFDSTVWLNLIFYTLANVLYGYLCFHISFKKSSLYGVFLVLLGSVWEYVVELILFAKFDIPIMSYLYDDLAITLVGSMSKGMLFISVLILSRFVIKENKTKFPLSFFIYPVALMVSITLIWYVCVFCGINKAGQTALAITCLVLLIPTTLLFFIYQRNMEKENEIFQLKSEMNRIETEKTYYDILEKQNQDLRIYAHDAKNHLSAIKTLNTDSKIDEYINKMAESLATYSKVSHSGNHILDVIINKYITECEIKNVKFSYDIRLKNLEYVEDYDLVTILGNLLDNALEAAEKSEKREISLLTDYRNTYDVLIITNSCDTSPKSSNEKLLTTKKDKKLHGLGLKSVIKTLKKYNGDFDWEYDSQNKIFTFTVMLSNNKK